MSKPVAVVVGATGAVGRELVGQLVTGGNWSKVTTVGRRPVELPAQYQGGQASLVQLVVDMDAVGSSAEAQDAFKGADAVFCALGTTRKDAGSAAAFKRVDYDYVAATAKLAKEGGARFIGLVSAQGANAGVWASDFPLLHPLLYTRTKGLAEEVVKEAGIPSTSIFRPGLLDRGDKARGIERLIAPIAPSIKVASLASVMVRDAERALAAAGDGQGVRVYEMGALRSAAAAAAAPV